MGETSSASSRGIVFTVQGDCIELRRESVDELPFLYKADAVLVGSPGGSEGHTAASRKDARKQDSHTGLLHGFHLKWLCSRLRCLRIEQYPPIWGHVKIPLLHSNPGPPVRCSGRSATAPKCEGFQDIGASALRHLVLRIDLNGLLETLQRLLVPTLTTQNQSEVVVCFVRWQRLARRPYSMG